MEVYFDCVGVCGGIYLVGGGGWNFLWVDSGEWEWVEVYFG